jgi:hypothetical protein
MKYERIYSVSKKLERQANLETMLILRAIWLQIFLNDWTVGYVDWALSVSCIHEGLLWYRKTWCCVDTLHDSHTVLRLQIFGPHVRDLQSNVNKDYC